MKYINKFDSFNQCFFQYRQAVSKLEEFKASEAFKYMKGSLIFKEEKKTVKGKDYFFTSTYHTFVDYVNGKRHKKHIYVKKADVAEFQRKLADKKKNRQTYGRLKKDEKTFGTQLQRLMRHGNVDAKILEEMIDHQNNHNIFRKTDKYANENQIIVSALGEKLRSRAECILANLAFAFHIPYLYEAAINIFGNNKYDGKYEETVHPDFSFIINGKRVLLELLGMTNNKEYKKSWRRKERHYRENGYKPGKNLICVECRDKQNIDSQKIAQMLIDLASGIIPRETIYV